jgi:hypothetical protein
MEEKYIKQIREIKQRHIYGDFLYNIMNNSHTSNPTWGKRTTLNDVIKSTRQGDKFYSNVTILQYAFSWRATKQGRLFWEIIDEELRTI